MSLNWKNIKSTMEHLYEHEEEYNKFWDSLQNLYGLGFLSEELHNKMFKYDGILWKMASDRDIERLSA